ncbi:tigger transposable element-derived protein 6-like protein [Plakobranchus ocellatus]|uniref:Tigger transposable element-derived protein 6-like protein n=1 Tax=Plakobranchus ocellatus TaxID=259542 RepID=A0AAV4B1G7_9GAST|nr:tigger transposable element-derived protein 6-like protein [Plakobranchus ocellatus]
MVRAYIKETYSGTYSRQDKLNAVYDVISKGISLRKAAVEHHVNYNTLSRYIKAKKNSQDGALEFQRFGYQKTHLVFPEDLERQLVDSLLSVSASKIFHGLVQMDEQRKTADELAVADSLSMPAS